MDRPREGTAAVPSQQQRKELKQAITEEIHEIDAATDGKLTTRAANEDVSKLDAAKEDTELAIIVDPNLTWLATPLFFYGTLMDPRILARIIGSDQQTGTLPLLQDATVSGYKTKMWGPYPTAIACRGAELQGKMWMCHQREYYDALQLYESNNYRHAKCSIKTSDGKVHENGSIFVWSGEADDPSLEDGSFDLKEFLYR